MKVDLDQVLKTPKGEPFNDNATLANAAYSAMQAQLPTDAQLPADKKMLVFKISQKLASGGEQEFTAEEIALVKDRCSQALAIFAYAAVANAFENAATVKSIAKDEQQAPQQEGKKA